MRPAIKMALLFSGAWILLKFILLSINVFQEDVVKPGLINNLFMLLAISFGLYFEKKKQGFGVGTPLSDIKNALSAGAPYVLIVSVFMFFYYDTINPSFIDNRVTERMDSIYAEAQDEAYVDTLRIHNPEFRVMTTDEIIREIKSDTESALSAKTLFVFSLLGLMVMALTYAIFITLIFRKILLRDYYPKS
ncbi:hypothetical protein ERX46_11830 [Brumimicrobium glaciale]|jgi:hypothetical protein|uniref:DUF4199 domain-containing protein n=1 Tax=Brumimicrobium glaciale TaxID=200475 RepID=A0A4Q4KIN0_9FLAO|nr:hypothetical protein [Brumimicrobium glaciale]RYM32748.1 hypothetical protein ERX46_11830 [Brumimicrobium glaciale]